MTHGIRRLMGAAGIAAVGAGALALFSLRPPALGLRVFPRAKWGPAFIHNAKTSDGRAVRLLRVGKSVQSATYLDEDSYAEPVFDYILAFDMVFDSGLPVRDILMVGGGGCAWPKHVVATRPDVHIDVLEADPEIIGVARRYFFLDKLDADCDLSGSGRLNLICADGAAYLASLAKKVSTHARTGHARSWLYGNEPRRYDAIVLDAFKAGEMDSALAGPAVICEAHDCLNEGGVLAANVVAAIEGPGSESLHAYARALKTAFQHVYIVPLASCPFDEGCEGSAASIEEPDNVIVVATDGAYRGFDCLREWGRE